MAEDRCPKCDGAGAYGFGGMMMRCRVCDGTGERIRKSRVVCRDCGSEREGVHTSDCPSPAARGK